MTMQQLTTFITSTIGGLPEDKRNAVRILFHNPTDASAVVFEQFAEWGGLETLVRIIDTAKELNIDNAGFIEDRFIEWTNSTQQEDFERDEADAAGCDVEFDGTEDINDARITKPYLFEE